MSKRNPVPKPGPDLCATCEHERDYHNAAGCRIEQCGCQEFTRVPWRDAPAACTNCGESAKPHQAYADFVGPFCEGCWDRLCQFFTLDAIQRMGER